MCTTADNIVCVCIVKIGVQIDMYAHNRYIISAHAQLHTHRVTETHTIKFNCFAPISPRAAVGRRRLLAAGKIFSQYQIKDIQI